MKKYIVVLVLTLQTIFVMAQNYSTQSPVRFPIPSTVWQFTKYGDIGINEYRGLADINIPLYNINIDKVSIPLQLNYFSGGIRVSEEASDVGLGWNFNIPTIIQSVKDKISNVRARKSRLISLLYLSTMAFSCLE